MTTTPTTPWDVGDLAEVNDTGGWYETVKMVRVIKIYDGIGGTLMAWVRVVDTGQLHQVAVWRLICDPEAFMHDVSAQRSAQVT